MHTLLSLSLSLSRAPSLLSSDSPPPPSLWINLTNVYNLIFMCCQMTCADVGRHSSILALSAKLTYKRT